MIQQEILSHAHPTVERCDRAVALKVEDGPVRVVLFCHEVPRLIAELQRAIGVEPTAAAEALRESL